MTIVKTYIDDEGHTVKVFDDEIKQWSKNGELHREGDKPAYIDPNGGGEAWYKNGKPHRENNPAGINDFYDYYFLNDERMNLIDYWIRLLLMEY